MYYCTKTFPYLLISILVKGNLSYYQSIKRDNDTLTFYTYLAFLFLLNISLSYFFLSSPSSISLRKRDTTNDPDLLLEVAEKVSTHLLFP